VVLGACLTNQGTATAMYAAEYDCPEEQVDYETVGGYSALMVKGCGYKQMYACQNGTCVQDGERRPLTK